MQPDTLDAATAAIRKLTRRRIRPLSWLEATFIVVEAMSEAEAKTVLQRLVAQRFLAVYDADLAQMLAQRLGVLVQWSHAMLSGDGEWIEGRGE